MYKCAEAVGYLLRISTQADMCSYANAQCTGPDHCHKAASSWDIIDIYNAFLLITYASLQVQLVSFAA